MNTILKLAVSFAAGAAAMYYLDPATGRRRRALARDQGVAARHEVEDYARAKSRRAVNRIRGVLAKTRMKVAPRPLDDEQLHDRIRAKLGRVVSHPGAVEVKVHGGYVVISGGAREDEINELLETVPAMRGVKGVDNRMSPTPLGNSESPDAQGA